MTRLACEKVVVRSAAWIVILLLAGCVSDTATVDPEILVVDDVRYSRQMSLELLGSGSVFYALSSTEDGGSIFIRYHGMWNASKPNPVLLVIMPLTGGEVMSVALQEEYLWTAPSSKTGVWAWGQHVSPEGTPAAEWKSVEVNMPIHSPGPAIVVLSWSDLELAATIEWYTSTGVVLQDAKDAPGVRTYDLLRETDVGANVGGVGTGLRSIVSLPEVAKTLIVAKILAQTSTVSWSVNSVDQDRSERAGPVAGGLRTTFTAAGQVTIEVDATAGSGARFVATAIEVPPDVTIPTFWITLPESH